METLPGMLGIVIGVAVLFFVFLKIKFIIKKMNISGVDREIEQLKYFPILLDRCPYCHFEILFTHHGEYACVQCKANFVYNDDRRVINIRARNKYNYLKFLFLACFLVLSALYFRMGHFLIEKELLISLFLFLVTAIAEAFDHGRIMYRFGYVYRADNKKLFNMCTSLFVLLLMFCFVAFLTL